MLVCTLNLLGQTVAVILLVVIQIDICRLNNIFQLVGGRQSCFSNGNACPGFFVFSSVCNGLFYDLYEGLCLFLAFNAAAEKDKLMPSHSAYDVGKAHHLIERHSHLFEHMISLHMAKGVVDILESVYINDEEPTEEIGIYILLITFLKGAVVY